MRSQDPSYQHQVTLNSSGKLELLWWVQNAKLCNGRCLAQPKAQMVVQTDASKTDWGTSCQGLTTRGIWSKQERSLQINVLELLAVKLALLCFTKNREVRAIHSIEVFDKDGSCEVFGNDQIKQRDMKLSFITWDHNYHRTPPKQTDNNWRQGVQGEGRFFRVETRPKAVLRATSINGEPSIRFVSISTKSSITPVHSLNTGSIQSGCRCDASGLVLGLPVCLSLLLPYKQNFTEGRARKNAKHVVDNTNMAHSTLVSISSSNLSRYVSYLPKYEQSS